VVFAAKQLGYSRHNGSAQQREGDRNHRQIEEVGHWRPLPARRTTYRGYAKVIFSVAPRAGARIETQDWVAVGIPL
jgi:hypothetical protein